MDRTRLAAPLLVVAIFIAVVAVAPPALAVPAGSNGLLAFASDRDGDNEIYVTDGLSDPVKLTDDGVYEGTPSWSPDGSRLAFVKESAACGPNHCRNVWIMDADGTNRVRITDEPDTVNDSGPVWTPDGQTIVYASTRVGGYKHLFSVPVAGGTPTQLTAGQWHDWAPDVSPDGTKLVFASTRNGSSELFTMRVAGGGESRVQLAGDVPTANVGEPSWSPDGSSLAFRGSATLFTTTTRLYVASADGSGSRVVYDPSTFVYTPRWSPDGTHLALAVDHDSNGKLDIVWVDPAGCPDPQTCATLLASGPSDDFAPAWGSNLGPLPSPGGGGGGDVTVTVTAGDNVFTPRTPTVDVGTTVIWSFAGLGTHTATDASGLGLYDSGVLATGSSSSYGFTSAGVFAFACSLHRKMTGSVTVPMSAGSVGGQIVLTFGSSNAPAGYGFDVQVLRPGAKKWKSVVTGGSSPTAVFVPDAGSGTYRFRAALRRFSNGAASAWSPVVAASA
jgi:TolB protein